MGGASSRDKERKGLAEYEVVLANDDKVGIGTVDLNEIDLHQDRADAPCSKVFYYCNECASPIRGGFLRYHCWNPPKDSDYNFDYDVCQKCFDSAAYSSKGIKVTDLYREKVETEDPHVLVDRCQSVAEAILIAADCFKNRPTLGFRSYDAKTNKYGDYFWRTWAELWASINAFAKGLKACNATLKPGDMIGIFARNCYEWVVCDYASILLGFIIVPMANTFDQASVDHVINITKMSVIVCDKDTEAKVLAALPKCPTLTCIINVDDVATPKVLLFSALSQKGKTMPDITYNTKRDPSTIFTLVPTSGSTGVPKCVIFSTKSYNQDVFGGRHARRFVDIIMAPLPYVARINVFRYLLYGNRTGFATPDPSTIFEDIYLLKPNSLSGVPRFWQVLHTEFEKGVDQTLKDAPTLTREGAGKVQFEVLKEKLGGQVLFGGVGGAHVSKALFDWMEKLFPMGAVESYGTTEAGSIYADKIVKKNVKVKLVDWEDYTGKDLPFPRGEICVLTKTMFGGYYGDQAQTSEALDNEGYYHTGDIGKMETLSDGSVHITLIDRKKHLFKLAQGEFVSPEKLEGLFSSSDIVDQVYVHGDREQSLLIAVIKPNLDRLKDFLAKNKLEGLAPTWDSSDEVKKAVLKTICEIGLNARIRMHELPRGMVLVQENFTQENGLLTPTGKLCRRKIAQKYDNEINSVLKSVDLKKADPISSLGLVAQNKGRSIKQLINNVLERDENADITPEDDFLSLGGDSLAAAKLVNLMNKEFNVDVPIQNIFDPEAMKKLSACKEGEDLAHLTSAKAKNLTRKVNWSEEITLEASDLATLPKKPRKMAALVTGANGFLGMYLTREIIERGKFESVVCLVRAKSNAEAQTRLKEAATKYKLFDTKVFSKIRTVAGDISKPKLGLTDEVYEELSNSVSFVYNNAAHVNSVLNYHDLKPSNVDGVRNVIKFATNKVLKEIHHVSTLSVLIPGSFIRDELAAIDITRLGSGGGYNQSKRVGEFILNNAKALGVPVVIYRPGTISGHSVSGCCNEGDYMNRLMKAILTTGKYPLQQNHIHLDLTPVDYVAAGIATISLKKKRAYPVYHFTQKHIEFGLLIQYFKELGHPLKEVPWKDWLKEITENDKHPLFALLHYFKGGFLPNFPTIPDTLTRNELANEVDCPIMDRKVAEAYASFLLKK